jgi:hypothetical protein
MFSSLMTLARALGDTPWLSTTGKDLLDLLPDGFRLVLDPGTPHARELTARDTAL